MGLPTGAFCNRMRNSVAGDSAIHEQAEISASTLGVNQIRETFDNTIRILVIYRGGILMEASRNRRRQLCVMTGALLSLCFVVLTDVAAAGINQWTALGLGGGQVVKPW